MKLVEKYDFLIFPIISALLLSISRLPVFLGWLSFFGFVPLFILFENRLSWKKSLLAAISFVLVYNSVSLHWIALVTIGGFIGMYVLFSLYFFLLFRFFSFFHGASNRIIAMICIWISFEYIQSVGEFRFPWLTLGYSLVDFLPFLQLAEVGSIYLISFLILLLNWFLYKALHKKIFVGISVVFVLIWFFTGSWRLQQLDLQATGKKISIVQVSIPQEKKWNKTYLDTTLFLYRDYTKKASSESQLVIWPESALPLYLAKSYQYREYVYTFAERNDVDIFTGFPDFEKNPARKDYKFFNSASLFSKNREKLCIYHKNILVPFGERMPFLDIFPFLWDLQLGQANFEYGDSLSYYQLDSYNFSPLICFEIAFPELSRKMSENADFLVNITNDAWFKRSIGTYQHAMMAVVRAIETRKQIYRAANTGYSMIISPSGKILNKSKLFEKTILREELFVYPANSIFTKYLGFFPFVFIVGAVMNIIFLVFYRKRVIS